MAERTPIDKTIAPERGGMKNLLGALLKAQQDFPILVTDAVNPAYRSRYATLSAVQEVAFPVLHKHGLVVLQSVRTDVTENGLIVYVGATLYHAESGEETSQELGMLPVRQDPQAIGSAITYGRRYLLMTMLGLVADDDDGNAASRTPQRMAQTAHAPLAQNGNGAGKAPRMVREGGSSAKVTLPTTDVRPDWQSVGEAVAWGLDLGVFDDAAAAKAELRTILQAIYPGRDSCKAHELPAVLDGWYAEVRRRLHEKQPA